MTLDYPAVVARLTKWGMVSYLSAAHDRRLSRESAIIYARAICGPKTIVRVKRVRRSMAYPHNESITLACDNGRTVQLSSILHEAAHVLSYRKGKLGGASHGEGFCRTYARLLREVQS